MTLRVATAGTGFFSQFHYDAWSRLPVELVACCSLDAKLVEELAALHNIPACFENFETMLDEVKPDLVDIITPPPTHLTFVTAAARRGIASICQKPFCQSLDEARQAVSILEETGGLCVIHENFRFQPWYAELKGLMDDGAIGKPLQISFRLRPGDGQGPDAYLHRQPYFQSMPRFLVHETAIHFIDVFRYLAGPVVQLTAELRQLNPVIAGEDAGFIIFEFESGVRGLFDGNRLADHPATNRRLTMGEMLIEGEQGTLNLDGDGRIYRRAHGKNEWAGHDYAWSEEGFGGDCVHRLQAHVVDHLLNGQPVQNVAADYLANLKVEDAVYRSSETGRRVSLQSCT